MFGISPRLSLVEICGVEVGIFEASNVVFVEVPLGTNALEDEVMGSVVEDQIHDDVHTALVGGGD